MDPRHPENAIPRMGELIEQYDRILREIRGATVAAKLGELEREGSLVVQEICLVAPRLHEAMMQDSRIRRTELAKGLVGKPVENLDIIGEENIGGESKSVKTPVLTEKPKNVKTGKKKTTKKAKK